MFGQVANPNPWSGLVRLGVAAKVPPPVQGHSAPPRPNRSVNAYKEGYRRGRVHHDRFQVGEISGIYIHISSMRVERKNFYFPLFPVCPFLHLLFASKNFFVILFSLGYLLYSLFFFFIIHTFTISSPSWPFSIFYPYWFFVTLL